MVTSEDLVLDEVILQVFEEQDDAFHFPVTSQKHARAFVKALHKKGLSYDCLSLEIKELEQSFSAWRTGISRSGIGNRVIERINRPLQEVLLSDGEDDSACCDQLSTCSDDTTESGEANHNGADSFQGKEDQLTTESESADNRKSAQNLGGKEVHKTDDLQMRIEKNMNGNKGSIEKIATEEGQGDSQESVRDNLEVKEISSVTANGSDDGADKKNIEVVAQQSESAFVGNENPLTKVSEVKNECDLKAVKAEKLDIKNATKETANSENEKLKEHSDLKSLLHEKKGIEYNLTLVTADSSNNIHNENAESQYNNSSENSIPQEKASSIEVELWGVINEVATDDAKLSEKQRPNYEFVEHLNDHEHKIDSIVKEKYESVQENEDISSESILEVAVVKGSKILLSTEHLDRAQTTDDTGPSIQTGDINAKTSTMDPIPLLCCPSHETSTLESQKSSEDVLENYDSDLDNEPIEDDVSRLAETENEAKKETTKGSHSHDFGYIYVFTDNSSEDDEFRVKVGASRFPYKRLEQALLFNIDMKIVSVDKVCHRQKAVTAIQQQLSEYAIPSTIGWFRGPRDEIRKVLMAVIKDRPLQD